LEVLDYLDCEVSDGDAWGAPKAWGHDGALLYANSQAKLSSHLEEAVDESLKGLLEVRRASRIREPVVLWFLHEDRTG